MWLSEIWGSNFSDSPFWKGRLLKPVKILLLWHNDTLNFSEHDRTFNCSPLLRLSGFLFLFSGRTCGMQKFWGQRWNPHQQQTESQQCNPDLLTHCATRELQDSLVNTNTKLYNHHCYLIPEHFPHPQPPKTPCPLANTPHCPVSPAPTTTKLLSVSMDLCHLFHS